jgi:molybdenum cofactor biosynthesis protein B
MGHNKETLFRPAKVAIITVSDTRTYETDTSGQLIEDKLKEAGHEVVSRAIVKDEQALIRTEVEALLANRDSVYILITGGTGLTERDVTVEAIRPLYSKHIPGFGELFRMLSYEDIGTAAIQSRADAGLCGHAVVMALPGSTNACRLAMDRVILPQIDNRGRCTFRGVVPDSPS